ncbi:MAG TPA: hypothetical protein VGV61_14175 [Thermoanaerobaculia bacterium]|jgi:hypothetical protein|nr:hypothetical protein [Thermoanaerobaculia bacterium]
MSATPALVSVVQLAVLLAAGLAMLVVPRALDRLSSLTWRLQRLPGGFWTFAAGLALVALAVEALVAALAGPAVPAVHDEFSYLLAADTFAHGRLTNPAPALWRPFETFHVLLQPTYASKYPPGQGLVLALGMVLGHPLIGIWISGALLCLAAAWMLHGLLPSPWARLAAVLLALSLVAAGPWAQSYWGGFVAAAGGALLFGAAIRLRRAPSASAGAALGAGLLLLALTRPWEGAVAALATLLPLLFRRAQRQPPGRAPRGSWGRALATALLVLAPGLGWLGWYQWRVTGSAWTMPYRLYDQRYESTPVFLWQSPRHVVPSPHLEMQRFFRDFEGAAWRRQHTLRGWLAAAGHKLAGLARFYVGAALLPLLAGLPWALCRAGPRWAAGVLAALAASQLVIVPSRPHYVAPGACLVVYLLAESWRHLRLWLPAGRPLGARLAAGVPLALLLSVPVMAWAVRPETESWAVRRAALQRQLAALGGQHLVLVRYGPGHDANTEWVHDGADLAAAPVLWARAMDRRADCRLMAAEGGRETWLLTIVDDLSPPRLVPYPRLLCATAAAADRNKPAALPPAKAR